MEFDAKVIDIIDETPDTRTLRLVRPADFNFVAGQFVNVTIRNPRARRAYSIASSPQDPHLDLTVRRLPGGLVSKVLTENVAVGETLNLRGPYGRFVLADGPVVWVAGGSGIVPFRSMWRHISQTTSPTEFILLYATKSPEQIIFRSELAELSRGGKNIFHTFTTESPPDWQGFRGRVDKAMLASVVHNFARPLFYVCGPPSMCEQVARDLAELGVPKPSIRTEKYD